MEAEESMSEIRNIRVILADDHRIVTQALRSYLESFEDIQVLGTCISGEELLQGLASKWKPDVIVLDLLMPGGIDGIETTRRVNERFPEVQIVALTASMDEARMTGVLRAGAAGYVRKDADPEFLLKAVRAVADGRSFIDPAAAAGALITGNGAAEALSPRELEVVREVARGHSNREIGERLFISEETVKTHVARCLAKLQLQSRTQLVIYAVKNRIVNVEEL
jgi:NarL family two-component system response regulator LiaR